MTKMPKQIQPILSWREIWVLLINGQKPLLRSSTSRFDGKGIVQQNTIESIFQMTSSNSPLILLQWFPSDRQYIILQFNETVWDISEFVYVHVHVRRLI